MLALWVTSMNLQVFQVMQKQDWYKPDIFLYKDLIIALARAKRMDDVLQLWESMRKENLFPDSQTYTEVIRGFLSSGSPADAMNVYEDMKNSPDPPEELPFRILLKGLLPHPLLRNKVKQDFEEIFPDSSIYDPPQEIFGARWGLNPYSLPLSLLSHVQSFLLKKLCCFPFAFMETLGTRYNIDELNLEDPPELYICEYIWYICELWLMSQKINR